MVVMSSEARRWAAVGAGLGFLAVVLGAFGAHALRSVLPPERLAVWEVGVRYQMYHALALLAVPLLAGDRARRIGWCFVGGVALFSGSLYLLALTDLRWLGAVTPLGGVSFLVGWGLLALSAGRDQG